MNEGIILKIAAVGILITLLNQILKHSGREDQAFLLSLAGIVMVLIWIIPYIVEMFTLVQGLFEL
ncbi:MAG: stage III sporulation protein AC [Lachnospiraceae bacterium]|nr:stage III sporulation protein AC [Lachnospiraceae bacterium]MDE6687868.1 stage III sporulation protein AC [Lachnospiraceae bacterium]MDE6744764.1 stage III sporulation protein AC [Lachnospiraceae bacterium]